MRCETVKIKAENEQGFIIINKSDHKDEPLFGEKKTADKKSTKKPKK